MNFFVLPLKRLLLPSSQNASFRYMSIAAQQKTKDSYYFMNGNIGLVSSTLGDVLDNAADAWGDHTAFVTPHQGISKTFLELRNEADKLASGLIALGLQKGDRLAIYSPNCYEWPLTQFAAAKAGLVLVALNFTAQADEMEYFLKNSGSKAVISYDHIKNHDYYEIFKKILPNLSTSNPRNLQNKKLPNLQNIIMISDDSKDGTVPFKEVSNLRNRDSDVILSKIGKLVQFDDPVNIQYTSGTTGVPKGAVLNHHGTINNAITVYQRLGYNSMNHVLCCQVPLFHAFGGVSAVLGTLLFQGTCVLPSLTFDSVASLRSIEDYKCTIAFGTPTMYVDMIKNQKQLQFNIDSLQQALVGGSPVTDNVIKEIHRDLKVPHVHRAYGLTENSPGVAITGLDTDIDTVIDGYMEPLEHIQLKIVDEKGHVVPMNAQGELHVRGYAVFLGYLDDTKKTAETIDEAYWLHTGDLAVMNEKGWVKIVGRIKDMVIRGGENIYVAEVENFLSTHPAILEAQVVGVPDDRLGEELCCWISLKAGMTLTEEEVRDFCKGKISHYKIPRYIMFVKEFPKTTTGKVKKTEMVKISREKLNL